MSSTKRLLTLAISAALAAPLAAHATNGMNMEGYGPIATGMGGASMAYDNGTAAMMNNPATLSMMDSDARLDVAVGVLGPDVTTKWDGINAKWDSKGTSYTMPAVGYVRKSGQLTYGFGAFAQGGMGTEYKPTTTAAFGTTTTPGTAMILGGGLAASGNNNGGLAAELAGVEEMSEVGVMRILFPLSYDVNEQLNIGGSLDYVRAQMDLKMAMPGGMMMDMMPGGSQVNGTITGSMITAMGGFMTPGSCGAGIACIQGLHGGYFDFADSNPYTGATEADGFAGKLGLTYKMNDKISVGATYHSKTSLGDMSGDADVTMGVAVDGSLIGAGGGTTWDVALPLSGKVKIKDFQWPDTYGLGISVQASDKLMIAADWKRINWSGVMKDFKMSFTASGNTGVAAGFNGTTMDAVLAQNWDDQDVFQIGGAYEVNADFVVRLGANISKNPIPNSTLHYLFPAIVETHYTAGFGWAVTPSGEINFSLTHAPSVSATNPGTAAAGDEIKVTHGQTSWQLMYSHSF